MATTRLNSEERTTRFTAGADFCRIFMEDMKGLYLLALILTADSAKAEQCFVSGLDDCAAGNQVFKEWARSWARRTIIRNAVRLVAPQPLSANGVPVPPVSNGAQPAGETRSILQAEISVLFELGSFERFAFVMSVLEGYSDQDCALLLGCTRAAVIAARVQASQQIARDTEVHRPSRRTPGRRPDVCVITTPSSS